MRLSISKKEIIARQERFWGNLQQLELDCAIIFSYSFKD